MELKKNGIAVPDNQFLSEAELKKLEKQANAEKKEEDPLKALDEARPDDVDGSRPSLVGEMMKPCQICPDKDILIETLRTQLAEAKQLAQSGSTKEQIGKPVPSKETSKPEKTETKSSRPATASTAASSQKVEVKKTETKPAPAKAKPEPKADPKKPDVKAKPVAKQEPAKAKPEAKKPEP